MQISIPEPCHESWAEMTPNEQGRHCSACAKTVVDFTKMSDAQVLAHLKKASGNTCGRIRNDQLERPLVAPIIGGIPRWVSVGLASIAAVISSSSVFGQQIQGEVAAMPIDTSRVEQTDGVTDTVDLEEIVVTGYSDDPMEVDEMATFGFVIKSKGLVEIEKPHLNQISASASTAKKFQYSGTVMLPFGELASFAEVSFITHSGKVAHTIKTKENAEFECFFAAPVAALKVNYFGQVIEQAIDPQKTNDLFVLIPNSSAIVVGHKEDYTTSGITAVGGMMLVYRKSPFNILRSIKEKTLQGFRNVGRVGNRILINLKKPALPAKNPTNKLVLEEKTVDLPIKEKRNGFTLFPNPSTGNAKVQLIETSNASILNIHNQVGQLIQSRVILTGESEVEISLPPKASRGIYTVQLSNASGETISSQNWIVQ